MANTNAGAYWLYGTGGLTPGMLRILQLMTDEQESLTRFNEGGWPQWMVGLHKVNVWCANAVVWAGLVDPDKDDWVEQPVTYFDPKPEIEVALQSGKGYVPDLVKACRARP
jgi:hypothetical protein